MVAGIVVALIAAVVIAFSCWRWAFANDVQDIQGTWYIAGTQKTAAITADGIQLADDVTYSYAIDEGAKTLSLSFGTMTGDARYRFSLDRQTLAIRDGKTSWADSLIEDISWSVGAFARAIQGDAASPEFSGASTMVLTRTPQTAATAQAAAGEQAASGQSASSDAQSSDAQAAGSGSQSAGAPSVSSGAQGASGSAAQAG